MKLIPIQGTVYSKVLQAALQVLGGNSRSVPSFMKLCLQTGMGSKLIE